MAQDSIEMLKPDVATRLSRVSAGRWFSAVPERVLRRIRAHLLDVLDRIEWGSIQLRDALGSRTLGAATAVGPRVEVDVHDLEFYAHAGLGGSTGAGQSYFMGLWDTDQLVDVVRILVRNAAILERMDSGLARIGAPLWQWYHRRRENTLQGSRNNISAHYDLGNDFFEVMLDPTMMYSSAIYPDASADLETAQRHRLDVICDKLALGPENHLLEIGTGWGGLAIHAASRHGCRVTTTTISRAQHDYAVHRVAAAGLSDLIDVRFDDYRELTGQYDRLVSVEMIEAVGHRQFPTYFATLDRLLTADGLALLQAITIEDQRYAAYRDSVDFIQRFVFPGGCLPSLGVMLDCIRDHTTLKVRHVEDIGDHYARTLMDWQTRVDVGSNKLNALGYDQTFLRLWRFYLAYCTGGFMERSIGDVQLLLQKPLCRVTTPVSGAVGRPYS
jgi:cyclopropane-fatty-acyl-phospholipid synthase